MNSSEYLEQHAELIAEKRLQTQSDDDDHVVQAWTVVRRGFVNNFFSFQNFNVIYIKFLQWNGLSDHLLYVENKKWKMMETNIGN